MTSSMKYSSFMRTVLSISYSRVYKKYSLGAVTGITFPGEHLQRASEI
jgi:hypothetical protein